jgi:hypothetical protein
MSTKNTKELYEHKSSSIDDYRIRNASKTNRKKYVNKEVYVYLINLQGTDFYKIGVSQSPKRRIKDLASATPFIVDILYLNSHENAFDLEDEIHLNIKKNYIRHEWFRLSPLQVSDIIFKLTINLKQNAPNKNI